MRLDFFHLHEQPSADDEAGYAEAYMVHVREGESEWNVHPMWEKSKEYSHEYQHRGANCFPHIHYEIID